MRRGLTVLIVVLGGLLLLAGGTAYAAYKYDLAKADRILPGISIAGIDVGGMTREQAIEAVRSGIDTTVHGDMKITAGKNIWHSTPADLGLHVDVDGAVDQAFRVGDSMSMASRVWHRLREEPVGTGFELTYQVGPSKVKAFVSEVEQAVAKDAVDASIDLVGDKVVMTRSHPGQQLKSEVGLAKLRRALLKHAGAVRLPVQPVAAQVTPDDLGYTIVVRKSENMLYLYDGFKVVKSYPVATAAPGYDTPTGQWSIINKVENPTWHNPAPDGWGAGEPLEIPPGPGNPLGTRALYLDAPGIRIHGTYSDSSIGTYASHGCIRMHISDSEELFGIVPIGTKVIILW
jgi:lipoprotein-anchoring transpeptidase ErfK/SrfK